MCDFVVLSNSYERPGPDFRFKIYTYWFIDIQDMVDNAIISLHAGPKNLVHRFPGVYGQQLPYPCWQYSWFVVCNLTILTIYIITRLQSYPLSFASFFRKYIFLDA